MHPLWLLGDTLLQPHLKHDHVNTVKIVGRAGAEELKHLSIVVDKHYVGGKHASTVSVDRKQRIDSSKASVQDTSISSGPYLEKVRFHWRHWLQCCSHQAPLTPFSTLQRCLPQLISAQSCLLSVRAATIPLWAT